MISLTPPYTMPPKYCQLCAPCRKASGNTSEVLVDPAHNGNNLSFDGGDERTDASNDNTVVNTCLCHSGPPASQYPQNNTTTFVQVLQSLIHTLDATQQNEANLAEQIHSMGNKSEYNVARMEATLSTTSNLNACHLDTLNSKMDSLLQKMYEACTENTGLCEAYGASKEKTVLLKAAVDTLIKKHDQNITISAPPLTGNCQHLHYDGGDDEATVPYPR
jgi:hypothetical protein